MSKKILIINPTYNEAENILRLIDEVLGLDLPVDVLVVDDNSPDGTGELVQKNLSRCNNRLHLIRRTSKRGYGASYIEGFKFAIKNHYDYVIQMDADFSHSPKEIPNFVEKMEEYDLVTGSRFLYGIRVINYPLNRLLISLSASLYSRVITGFTIRDHTTGYKCIRTEVLKALDLDAIYSTGYSFNIELNFRIWKKGFRIHEIPIIFYNRQIGITKMTDKIILEAIFIVWKLKILSLLGRL